MWRDRTLWTDCAGGDCVMIVWWLCGDCVVIVWWLCGDCVVIVWWLCDDCVMIVWWLCDDCAVIVWWLCGDCAVIVWWLCDDCVVIVWWLCGDCEVYVQRLYSDTIVITHKNRFTSGHKYTFDQTNVTKIDLTKKIESSKQNTASTNKKYDFDSYLVMNEQLCLRWYTFTNNIIIIHLLSYTESWHAKLHTASLNLSILIWNRRC